MNTFTGPRSVLIVEDSFIVACHLELAVLEMGHNVIALCETAESAIDIAAKTIPHLVIMDITLKGEMDGIKCASILKERYGMPVIYLTALTDRDTFQRAEQSQPFGYISKPFDDAEISKLILNALC